MKAINIVLGLATAIILGALVNLGIRAFYPEPAYPTYPPIPTVSPCAPNDAACLKSNDAVQTQARAAQDQFNTEQQAYMDAMKVYNRNLFIIANILGIILFAIGFFLVFGRAALAARGVPVGIMIAGLWSIMYGYARGWGSVDDVLKFFIGLVIAALVIGGSMWLMERHARNA